MKIKDLGEIKLIKRLAKGVRLDRSVIKGIGDDTAVIAWKRGSYLLYTCDMLVEDVHFKRAAATPFQIGWKAMGRTISDIAAMGGVPRYALVSCAIDPGLPVSYADGIYKGMKALTNKFGINLVGGDTCRSKKIAIDVSLIGEVERKNLVTRCGAKPGDLILVTGAIGGSVKGKHLTFMPRLDEARSLVKKFKLNAMIDVTDGLLLDLWRILDASGAGARIHQSLIPVSDEADSFEKALSDGEDFELLFTMSPLEARRFFKTQLVRMKTPVTLIGEVTDKRDGFRLVMEDGKQEKVTPEGYVHF